MYYQHTSSAAAGSGGYVLDYQQPQPPLQPQHYARAPHPLPPQAQNGVYPRPPPTYSHQQQQKPHHPTNRQHGPRSPRQPGFRFVQAASHDQGYPLTAGEQVSFA
jgi:hypothetical protein